MPRIVTEEDRLAKVGTKSNGNKRLQLSSILANDDADVLNTQLREYFQLDDIADGSSSHTNIGLNQQKALIDQELRFKIFMRETYPKMEAAQLVPKSTADANDPLNYSDVRNLCFRLKAYLSFYVKSTSGYSEDGQITRGTLKNAAMSLVKIVGNHIKNQNRNQPFDVVNKILVDVYKHDATAESGVCYQIYNHASWLAKSNNLPNKVTRNSEGYGRRELELCLNDMKSLLFCGQKPAMDILQRMIIIMVAHSHGLRIGSMVSSDLEDEERQGMAVNDVSFVRTELGKWTLHLRVRHLKGFNTPLGRTELNLMMPALNQAENLHLEPTTLLLVVLMRRGKLQEAGENGKFIYTVDDLLFSNAHKLLGVGDEPLFVASYDSDGSPKPLDSGTAHNRFMTHVQRLKLPSAGFHNFRRDFGKQMAICIGDEATRLLMNHEQEHNVLNRNYTGGIINYHALGIRSGEVQGAGIAERLAVSTYYEQRLGGVAHQMVAKKLANGDAVQLAQIEPGSRAWRDKTRRHSLGAFDAYCKRDAGYYAIFQEFERLAASLEKETGIKVHRTSYFAKKTAALKAVVGRFPPFVASQLTELIRVKALEKASRHKLSIKYKIEARREINKKRKQTASVTTDQMREAAVLLENANYQGLPLNATVAAGPSKMMTGIAETARGTAKARTPEEVLADIKRGAKTSDEVGVDGETLNVALDTMAKDGTITADLQGHSTYVEEAMQQPIYQDTIPDGKQSQEATIALRLAWLRIYFKVYDGPMKMKGLIDFMSVAGYCPICPFGANNHYRTYANKMHSIFRIPGLPERSCNLRRHLTDDHPQAVAALSTGDSINAGLFQSPFNPIWAQHPLFQTHPQIARQYIAPLARQQMSDDQYELVKKWASMPAFRQPINAAEKNVALQVLTKLTFAIPIRGGYKKRGYAQSLMCGHDYKRTLRQQYDIYCHNLLTPVTLNGPARYVRGGKVQSNKAVGSPEYRLSQLDPSVITSKSKYSFRYHPYKQLSYTPKK